MSRRLALVMSSALLTGCTVGDDPYPAHWDPLGPSSATDCRHFEGTYADRGEAPGHSGLPSLTRELFGQKGPWAKARTLQLELPAPDVVEVSVAGPEAELLSHRFTTKSGDFRCEGGRMVLRNRRWVASDIMSGRESVTIELHDAGRYLVAHVQESTTGVMFMVVPLAGENTKWFRFPRLAP